MKTIEQNPLFTEVTAEESATVSGGVATVAFGLDTYLFVLGAGVQFGNPGLTADEVQFAWEKSLFSTENFQLVSPVPRPLD